MRRRCLTMFIDRHVAVHIPGPKDKNGQDGLGKRGLAGEPNFPPGCGWAPAIFFEEVLNASDFRL